MDTDTILFNDLRAADEGVQFDAAIKKILSHKLILARIMKDCLPEYKNCTVRDIADHYMEGEPAIAEIPVLPDRVPPKIRGAATEDTSIHEGTVTYDIRFYAFLPGRKERVQIIINVEAQNDFYPGYPLPMRGIYYCCRMISSQYGTEFTNSHYEQIKKVCSVWICTNPPKGRKNTITRYAIHEENLVGEVHEDPDRYDLLSLVMVCLGDPEDSEGSGLLRFLDKMLSEDTTQEEKRRVYEDEFDVPMSRKLESEVAQMCNLSQGIMKKSHAEGLAEGLARGRAEERLEALQNIMEEFGVSLEKAMTAMKIPQDERKKYQELLAQ